MSVNPKKKYLVNLKQFPIAKTYGTYAYGNNEIRVPLFEGW